MTPVDEDNRRTDIAMLRGGCSYGEASDRAGLSLEEVIALWKGSDMPPRQAVRK